MIFNMLPRLSSKLTLKFSHLQNYIINPCSLPSLPHKNIKGRESNGEVLVWWIKSVIKRQSGVCCISTEIEQEKFAIEFAFLTEKPEAFSLVLNFSEACRCVSKHCYFSHLYYGISVILEIGCSNYLVLHRTEILRLKVCNGQWFIIH